MSRYTSVLRVVRSLLAVAVVLGLLASFGARPAAAVSSVQSLADGLTAQQLAEALVGTGLTISNVTYTGAPVASGIFSGGGVATSIGIDSGVVLSSGEADDAIGPNTAGGLTVNNGAPGDADLSAIVNATTNNASVLQFNFTTPNDRVSFEYVFGSEEYNEYANSQFNDVFAFFINGQNCATFAGGTPVSINSINLTQNPSLYRNNAPGPFTGTQLDGFTVLLTCQAEVIPGATNTVKLAIADTSDTALDSWVFLAGGSFSAQPGSLALTPATAINPLNTPHTVTATVTQGSTPLANVAVTFDVTAGPNTAQAPFVGTTDANGQVSYTYVGTGGPGTDTISASFVDALGNTIVATAEKVWEGGGPTNSAPVVAVAGGSGAEGSPISVGGSVSDPDGDALTISWSYATGAGVDAGATCSFSDPTAPNPSLTCTDDGSYSVTATANDGVNAPVTASGTVAVSNADPVVAPLSVAPLTVYVGDPITIGAGSYSDAGSNDTHTAVWDLGNGTTLAPPASGGSVPGASYAYSAPGTYTISLTVTDDDGGVGTATTTVTVRALCTDATIADSFNRANGGLGANWMGATSTGRYRISGNAVYADAGGLALWKPTAFGSDQFGCLTLTKINPTGKHHTLALKAQSTDFDKGVILVSYSAPETDIVVEYRDPVTNKWVEAARFDRSMVDGDELSARARADGSVQVFVNDTLVGATAPIAFFAGKGGRAGVFFDSSRSTFDNFGAGNP